MSYTATFKLDQAQAHAVAAALDNHPDFESCALDLREIAAGEWTVAVYFEDRPDAARRQRLGEAVAKAIGRPAPAIIVAELPDADWVARSLEGLPAVRAGRFVVHGAHERNRVAVNDIGIEIEAGLAFGTGHHGTTTGCLIAIGRLVATRPIENALDVGTGTGVLAIAIARLAHAPVLATDIDPVAVRVARENIRLNGAAGWVRTATAAGLSARIFAERGPFDLIVANILAGPLVRLAPAIRKHLAPGGTVILSGLLIPQRARVLAAYRAEGLRLTGEHRLGEWLTLVFTRSIRTRRRRFAAGYIAAGRVSHRSIPARPPAPTA